MPTENSTPPAGRDLGGMIVAVVFILVNVLVFGLIARFGDLPRLLGAWSARDE